MQISPKRSQISLTFYEALAKKPKLIFRCRVRRIFGHFIVHKWTWLKNGHISKIRFAIIKYITTSRRFKCVPQILGSLSIHIFKLLFFLITHSCRVFADHAAHFAERKFFDVGEKYFFCFQPVLGIKPPRQIYCAAWSIVTQRKIKIHGSKRQQITDEIFFKQKNEFTNV